jgi:hypothetical protein
MSCRVFADIRFLQQILYNLIQQIAQLYPAGPTRDKYTAAAADFRIPYWDWAAVPPAGQSVFPSSVGGSPYVVVDGPVGTQTIANPLWSYQFNPLNPNDLPDFPVRCSRRITFLITDFRIAQPISANHEISHHENRLRSIAKQSRRTAA